MTTAASKRAINVEVFKQYALETARMSVELYGWYYMPASVHKILIHGGDIICAAPLPIGVLSEEPQESRNKDIRRYRDSNTRKISTSTVNEDLMNILLISSDPLISSKRTLKKAKNAPYPPEVINLLLPLINENYEFTDSEGLMSD